MKRSTAERMEREVTYFFTTTEFWVFGNLRGRKKCRGVLRAKPAKHPHIFPLPREILKTHNF